MNFSNIINHLFEAFEHPLPGYAAHLELAPYRKKMSFDFKNNNPKIASTLLLLYPKENNIFFSLIERPKYNGTHSSQISFPGGKNESGETVKQTALRETNEEIGVNPIDINIIGELTQVYVPPSNFLIHPFIGYCNICPEFKINKREVNKLIEVNILKLFDPELIKNKQMRLKGENKNWNVNVPYMDLNNEIVWGATSVILNEFRKVLEV